MFGYITRAASDLGYDVLISLQQLTKAQASFAAAERQIDQLREEFRKSVLADLAEAEARARLAREDLNKANLRRYQQSLKAPIDGVVQQLAVHTIGAVVKHADPLLVVVPGEGEFLTNIEQRINKQLERDFIEGFEAVPPPPEKKPTEEPTAPGKKRLNPMHRKRRRKL